VSVAERALHREDVEIVSPGAVSLAGHELGFATGLLVRDPDGHAILLAD
jgi:hypothetical protein